MPGSFSCSVAEMSEAGRIERRAIHAARRDLPHRRIIIALVVVAIILAVASVVSLVLGVRNLSTQNASMACQGQLQRNQDAQNVAGQESRLALRIASQALADAAADQAADLDAVLDPDAPAGARMAALADFQDQAVAISVAFQAYVDSSAAADEIRADNPTTFRC